MVAKNPGWVNFGSYRSYLESEQFSHGRKKSETPAETQSCSNADLTNSLTTFGMDHGVGQSTTPIKPQANSKTNTLGSSKQAIDLFTQFDAVRYPRIDAEGRTKIWIHF